ncbi:MAG: site-specific integrase [Chlorobiales bacterium]|jgi:site-specific recombinase XerD|nr:site-specific integrase [Chlorobiales bacterium]
MKTVLQLSVAQLDREIQTFLTDYLKDKSEETAGTYQRALREFQRYHAVAHEWFLFRIDDIEQYKRYLMQEKKLSEVSVSTYLTSLRRLLDYFVSQEKLSENPAKKIKGNRRPERHTAGVLSEDEVEKLLKIIPKEKPQDHRDYITIRLMLDCAASEHELVKANVEDLKKFTTHYALFVQAKGQKTKDDVIEVPLGLGEEIHRYLSRRKSITGDAPLLASHSHRISNARMTTRAVRYRVNHWMEAAGVLRGNISPHSLRHTAAKLWLERDKLPIEEVKRRMRHGTLSTTQIYTASTPDT